MGLFLCMMSLYVGELQEKCSIIENSKFNKCIYGDTHSLKHSLREFKLKLLLGVVIKEGIRTCGAAVPLPELINCYFHFLL